MFVIQNKDMVRFYRNAVKKFVFVLFAYFISSRIAVFKSLAMLRPGVSESLLTAIIRSPSCIPYG